MPAQELTEQWEAERQLLDDVQRLKEEVERVRLEIAAAERAYDLERAARLMYDTLPALQAKLLHVLESGTVRAVGANKERAVDTRIVAATHRDLRDSIAAGTFREDLLYRLDVITIALPALRHRREDIPALIDHFLARAVAEHPASPVRRISRDALARLLEHAWPGNVRELDHVIERVVLLGRSPEVSVGDLPPAVTAEASPRALFEGPVVPMREMQRRYAAWAYAELGGRKLVTAEKLHVDVKTLGKWLQDDPEDA